jgi:hypothetical protein
MSSGQSKTDDISLVTKWFAKTGKDFQGTASIKYEKETAVWCNCVKNLRFWLFQNFILSYGNLAAAETGPRC